MHYQNVKGFSLVLENVSFFTANAITVYGDALTISEWRYLAKIIFYLIKREDEKRVAIMMIECKKPQQTARADAAILILCSGVFSSLRRILQSQHACNH